MCLHSITKRIDTPTDEVMTVYKVFGQDRDGLFSLVGAILNNRRPVVGEWVTREDPGTSSPYFDSNYPCGFHAFINREDAVRYARGEEKHQLPTVVAVLVRKVGTHGFQSGLYLDDALAVVAEEMFIPADWATQRN